MAKIFILLSIVAFIAYFQAYECDAALMYVHVPSSYQPRFPKVSLITNYEITYQYLVILDLQNEATKTVTSKPINVGEIEALAEFFQDLRRRWREATMSRKRGSKFLSPGQLGIRIN